MYDIDKILCVHKRSRDLEEHDTWPFVHIRDFQFALILEEQSDADHNPNVLVKFLKFDFRNYSTPTGRVDDLKSLTYWTSLH